MLNCAPGSGLGAGIGIVAGGGHIEGCIWLGERCGDASKYEKHGRQFNADHFFGSPIHFCSLVGELFLHKTSS
jgi:hypothetical protein